MLGQEIFDTAGADHVVGLMLIPMAFVIEIERLDIFARILCGLHKAFGLFHQPLGRIDNIVLHGTAKGAEPHRLERFAISRRPAKIDRENGITAVGQKLKPVCVFMLRQRCRTTVDINDCRTCRIDNFGAGQNGRQAQTIMRRSSTCGSQKITVLLDGCDFAILINIADKHILFGQLGPRISHKAP